MTNKTGQQCPECGHETLAVKIGGLHGISGKVHCKRNNCGFEDKYAP